MIRTIGTVAALAVLAACSSGAEDSLVGRWENPDRNLALRLDEDGTFAASGPGGNTSGRYQVAQDGKLQMEFDDISTSIDVEIAGEQLTFCAPGHQCERLRRTK